MTPTVYSVNFKPLRMALTTFHDLADPSKALRLIYPSAYNPAALDSLKFLIGHILSWPMLFFSFFLLLKYS